MIDFLSVARLGSRDNSLLGACVKDDVEQKPSSWTAGMARRALANQATRSTVLKVR